MPHLPENTTPNHLIDGCATRSICHIISEGAHRQSKQWQVKDLEVEECQMNQTIGEKG
jgi:hypothetical protein